MGAIRRIVEPLVEPITLDDAKAWLRVDNNDEDIAIADLISGARQQVERDTMRCLVTQTWEMTVDQLGVDTLVDGYTGLPRQFQSFKMPPEKYLEFWNRWFGFAGARIVFPVRPVQECTAIQYRRGGAWVDYTTLPRTDGEGDLAFPSGSIPPISDELYDAVKMTVVCGYGDTALECPAWARGLIRMLVAHHYENRVPIAEGGGRSMAVELPLTYTDTIRKYRVMSL